MTTAAVLEHLRTFVVNRSHTSLQNALRNSFLINQPDDPKSKAIYLGQLARKLIDT